MALLSILTNGKLFGSPPTGAKIATLTIDVTISENHKSESPPTENPVEEGVNVTDHTERKPNELTINGLVTDTPLNFEATLKGIGTNVGAFIGKKIGKGLGGSIGALAGGALTGLLFGKVNRMENAYKQLQDLQDKRIPFVIVTGLRRYDSMLIASLEVNKDQTTGRKFVFTCTFKQVRIVQNATVRIPFSRARTGATDKKQDQGKKSTTEPTKDNKTFAKSLLDKISGAA